jgi:hypothetical protein
MWKLKALFLLMSMIALLWVGVIALYTYRETLIPFYETAEMSGLTYPSFSVSWYEPRLFGLDRDINPVFWDMPSPNRLNFIYSY